MALRLIQITCVLLLVAVLAMVKFGFQSVAAWGGPDFVRGFLFATVFWWGLLGMIMWVDPSSRPRGRSAQKKSPGDLL